MFFEMRFDLGTLDSSERSLPFGLLVLATVPVLVQLGKNSIVFLSFLVWETLVLFSWKLGKKQLKANEQTIYFSENQKHCLL